MNYREIRTNEMINTYIRQADVALPAGRDLHDRRRDR